jgi:hypothetical protein
MIGKNDSIISVCKVFDKINTPCDNQLNYKSYRNASIKMGLLIPNIVREFDNRMKDSVIIRMLKQSKEIKIIDIS